MSGIDARSVSIERLMPHRAAMRWIDRLIANDAESVSVEAVVRDDHPLADEAGVPGWAGLEFMAQAIAVWAGTQALLRNEPAKVGFLLGTRRYECSIARFAIGTRLAIHARCELFGDNGLGMFACRIEVDDVDVATANVSVFEPRDADAFLAGAPS